MNKKKLTKLNKIASNELLDTKAILTALLNIEENCYPTNIMIEMAIKKIKNTFKQIEENRKILNSTRCHKQ